MRFSIPGICSLLMSLQIGYAQVEAEQEKDSLIDPKNELPEALNEEDTARLVKAVDRGLTALQALQKKDGSFPSLRHGQPAVTSLAIMAYLSRGHLPGEGPYGETLDKAVNYVLSHQRDSGIFAFSEIDHVRINTVPRGVPWEIMVSKTYSHAITMLMLGEVYGLTGKQESFRIREAIEKGLKFTIQLWDLRKVGKFQHSDEGGFRYTRPYADGMEADLSVTAWHATSLRSIRNAGFDVPRSVMNRISEYVLRLQNRDGGFSYSRKNNSSTYSMTAAGTLCLALAGKYDCPEIKRSAGYLSRFRNGNRGHFFSANDRWPYYCCYYMTQSSIQLGGRLWVICMRESSEFLLPRQHPNGLWPLNGAASAFGQAYSTSMAILALTPTLQLLPIYQR